MQNRHLVTYTIHKPHTLTQTETPQHTLRNMCGQTQHTGSSRRGAVVNESD